MRFIHTLLIVGLLLTLVTSGQAFEKTVLVEYFTNVDCGPCAGQHDPIEDMLNNYTRDEIAYICYHVSWPSSSDGYYLGNTAENSGRRNYYGVNYVPWFQIEGLWGDSSSLNAILPNGVARIGTYTPYLIEFSGWPEPGATVPITATVTCAEPTNPNMRFNLVLIDKEMVIPPGSNGVDDYRYNMLDMAYSYTGQTFTSTGGNEELVFNYTFDIPGNNTFGNLAVVAFVQDYSTKEIYQSAFIAGPEVIIHGTVEHAVTGVPMWMAVVQLNGGNDGQEITGQDGRYGFNGLIEGDYVIEAFLNGYEQFTSESAFFEYGTHEVNLELVNEHENMDMISGAGANNDVHDAFEAGNYAYIAAGLDGFYIYDISDFANVVELSSLSLGGEIFDVIVDGDFAYVGTSTGVTSVDVSDPANPSFASSVTAASRVFSLVKDGNYVYGAGASAGLVVVNASNPNSLNLVTEFDTPGYARDVAVEGVYAYVADGVSGLTVVNISTPGSPVVAGDYNTSGYANGIAVEGTTAYVADDLDGVKIIDISNPNNPQLVSEINSTDRAKRVSVNGDFLFVAEYSAGVHAYDVSNPNNAADAGYSLTPGTTHNVSVFGDHAYVADDDWILMFDVSGVGAAGPATLDLTGTNTQIPAGGGTLGYEAHFTYSLPFPTNNVDYWAMVTLPGGQVIGPVMTQTFTAQPGMDVTVPITQDVPGTAPSGTYTYQGMVGFYPAAQLTDSFTFTKEGNNTEGEIDLGGWSTAGGFDTLDEVLVANAIPAAYELETAYPNPFNPSTSVAIALPNASDLTVTVFNVVGQQVATLANGKYNAGHHNFVFDGSNLSSGLYFIQAQVPGELNTIQKVTLMK